jgi:hypothetical protein
MDHHASFMKAGSNSADWCMYANAALLSWVDLCVETAERSKEFATVVQQGTP